MCFCLIPSGCKLWGARKRHSAFYWGLPDPRPGSEQPEHRWDHSEAAGRSNGERLWSRSDTFLPQKRQFSEKYQNNKPPVCHPQGLLEDTHPTVRSNATLGVCKILAKCWELLPPTIITDFLKKLVFELAADSSSPDVRCSVFKVENVGDCRDRLQYFQRSQLGVM